MVVGEWSGEDFFIISGEGVVACVLVVRLYTASLHDRGVAVNSENSFLGIERGSVVNLAA